MTRLTALKELADKVDAGKDKWSMYEVEVAFGKEYQITFLKAYSGSLDAALRLHNGALGTMSQYSIVTELTCGKVAVVFWPKGLSCGEECSGTAWFHDNPARAWLMAIVRAKIAELEATG